MVGTRLTDRPARLALATACRISSMLLTTAGLLMLFLEFIGGMLKTCPPFGSPGEAPGRSGAPIDSNRAL